MKKSPNLLKSTCISVICREATWLLKGGKSAHRAAEFLLQLKPLAEASTRNGVQQAEETTRPRSRMIMANLPVREES